MTEAGDTNPLWKRRSLLVLGTTYPVYSKKYTELVCTGAIDEETKSMVRLHPVPKRYLDEDQQFKGFQWITASTQPNATDGRPESLRVQLESISLGETIPATKDLERRKWIENSPSLFDSVEDLQRANHARKTSLGIVAPKSIDDLRIRRKTKDEEADWLAIEEGLLAQRNLDFQRPPKKIDFPEAEFIVKWTCRDAACRGHKSGIKSWPIHQGYRRDRGRPDQDARMLTYMQRELDLTQRDVFLFLGNFHNHRENFGIMDAYRPKRRPQALLPGMG